jgi:hypothetical protein
MWVDDDGRHPLAYFNTRADAEGDVQRRSSELTGTVYFGGWDVVPVPVPLVHLTVRQTSAALEEHRSRTAAGDDPFVAMRAAIAVAQRTHE